MQVTRWWDAQHGGIYVPLSTQTPPNPYLKDAHKNIVTTSGEQLTKINPAYMTRQISRLLGVQSDVSIRLFSEHPVNPEGSPAAKELAALHQFESGIPYLFEVSEKETSQSFFYAAPLVVEKSCLQCHQDYRLGDVRGGMSVSIRNVSKENVEYVVASYLVLLIVGLIGIWIYYHRVKKVYGYVEQQSFIDPLSRLYNRRYLMKQFDYVLNDAIRQQTPLAVLMCDIDDFKHYNDTFGHLAGDEVLSRVANSIKTTLKRHTDIAARYGGEEFIVLLPDTSQKGTDLFVERLLDSIRALEIHFSEEKRLTLSVGVSLWIPGEPDSQTVQGLIHQADVALYVAKSKGKNQAVFYDTI